jgi:hypothetical protein
MPGSARSVRIIILALAGDFNQSLSPSIRAADLAQVGAVRN